MAGMRSRRDSWGKSWLHPCWDIMHLFILFYFIFAPLIKKKGGGAGRKDALSRERGWQPAPPAGTCRSPSRRLKINEIKPNSCQLAGRRVGLGLADGPALLPLFRDASIYFSLPGWEGDRAEPTHDIARSCLLAAG